mmetsp:Transcript_28930/g.72692  ORF Transcript_28930/g.72692 Transcript_28930/m.72692 type:complete len:251 (+) Transcript_28930:312-1064(+)
MWDSGLFNLPSNSSISLLNLALSPFRAPSRSSLGSPRLSWTTSTSSSSRLACVSSRPIFVFFSALSFMSSDSSIRLPTTEDRESPRISCSTFSTCFSTRLMLRSRESTLSLSLRLASSRLSPPRSPPAMSSPESPATERPAEPEVRAEVRESVSEPLSAAPFARSFHEILPSTLALSVKLTRREFVPAGPFVKVARSRWHLATVGPSAEFVLRESRPFLGAKCLSDSASLKRVVEKVRGDLKRAPPSAVT